MDFKDLQFRRLFSECYEDLLLEREVSDIMKAWGEGLDKAIDDLLDNIEIDDDDERSE